MPMQGEIINDVYDATTHTLKTSGSSSVPGTGATNLGKAEDAVHASGDTGVMFLAVRKDTAVALAADGDYIPALVDANGALWVSLATKIAGEDLTGDVMKTENQYTGVLVAADTQVKGSAGFLHTLTFSCNDAAPTAGSIIVYNSLTEAGTQLFNHTFTTTPFVPFSVTIDAIFTTGLYVGFTTTNDVNVTVSYR